MKNRVLERNRIFGKKKENEFSVSVKLMLKIVCLSHIGLGLTKFDTIREHDTNPTRFLRVCVEYNRA